MRISYLFPVFQYLRRCELIKPLYKDRIDHKIQSYYHQEGYYIEYERHFHIHAAGHIRYHGRKHQIHEFFGKRQDYQRADGNDNDKPTNTHGG